MSVHLGGYSNSIFIVRGGHFLTQHVIASDSASSLVAVPHAHEHWLALVSSPSRFLKDLKKKLVCDADAVSDTSLPRVSKRRRDLRATKLDSEHNERTEKHASRGTRTERAVDRSLLPYNARNLHINHGFQRCQMLRAGSASLSQ